jgi:SAM-dependent methyltransferase
MLIRKSRRRTQRERSGCSRLDDHFVRRDLVPTLGPNRGAAGLGERAYAYIVSRSEYVEGGRPPGRIARRLQRLVLTRRYGMPPGALRDVDLVDIGFAAPGRVRQHIPSPWGVLRRILRPGEVTSDDVFIDIGCGMGPVLVEAAARYDFRRVIGIDVVPEFTEVARETISRGRERLRCQEIEIVSGDVIDYQLPDDVTVVYMADPFREHIFDAVIAKLVASVNHNPRQLRIIYNFPVEGGRL